MNTRYLFTCWDDVLQRLRSAPSLALILDFDGTLAPIVSRPALAVVPRATRRLLHRLAANDRLRVWIVSGRRKGDLWNRLRVPGIEIVGVYGWNLPEPRARSLNRVCRHVRSQVKGLPGIWVEDKQVCFAVHYRRADAPSVRSARRSVMSVVEAERELRLFPGKKVWEVVPKDMPGKDAVVRQLLDSMPPDTLAVYAGDDVADEAVFEAIPDGLTVCVGEQRTAANYFVRSPNEIWELLRRIEVLDGRPGRTVLSGNESPRPKKQSRISILP